MFNFVVVLVIVVIVIVISIVVAIVTPLDDTAAPPVHLPSPPTPRSLLLLSLGFPRTNDAAT
ncbi:hypothetical protein F5Y14DRAFT_451934 [Nemania sp. NC0429]|nr:hypothetical protein F5Y14DRAFT_451934 [Nemania sp. NC0429]